MIQFKSRKLISEFLENFVSKPNKQDFAMELISEFVFKEKSRSFPLSIIQEFQLVVVLVDYFTKLESKTNIEATKNAVFLSLFGSITQTRMSVLLKLMSTAISASIPQLLLCGGIWMQQLGATSSPSLELAEFLVSDFIMFSNKSSLQLKDLPEIAPG